MCRIDLKRCLVEANGSIDEAANRILSGDVKTYRKLSATSTSEPLASSSNSLTADERLAEMERYGLVAEIDSSKSYKPQAPFDVNHASRYFSLCGTCISAD